MNVAERIKSGALPRTLEEWSASTIEVTCQPVLWSGEWSEWCRMWWRIAWVRMQAFERDAEAEGAAEDWRGE